MKNETGAARQRPRRFPRKEPMKRVLLIMFGGASVMTMLDILGIGYPLSVPVWKQVVSNLLLMTWGWLLIESIIRWHRGARVWRAAKPLARYVISIGPPHSD